MDVLDGRSLTDTVLSWSVADILNDNLLVDKVESIPLLFSSVKQYMNCFMYPLLEETRAVLASSLHMLSEAPYAKVADENQLCGERYFKVEKWNNETNCRGDYSLAVGDVFLIVETKPEIMSEMLQLGANGSLMVVKSLLDGESFNFIGSVGVEISSNNESYVVFLSNLSSSARIWDSLHLNSNSEIFKYIICPSKNSLSSPSAKLLELIRLAASDLDESQLQALGTAISEILCSHKYSASITWGPPGSGKSTILPILVYALATMNSRILVCAPSDGAIARVFALFLHQVNKLRWKESSLFEFDRVFLYDDTYTGEMGEDLERRMNKASVIFCSILNSWKLLQNIHIQPVKWLVIDDAAQIKECEYIIPLQLPGIEKVFLFGDHLQIAPVVTSQVSATAEFGRSLFERMLLIHQPFNFLNTQYRMHPDISSFPLSRFYADKVFDRYCEKAESFGQNYLKGAMFGSYSFISVSCGREEVDRFGTCHRNMVEVATVVTIVDKLIKEWHKQCIMRKKELSIGILSAYSSQIDAVKGKLGNKYDKMDGLVLNVKTIDAFQGQQADIVILSTVRANENKSVGSYNEALANTCLTRARHCFWVVGDGRAISSCESIWKLVVDDAKNRQCFYDAEADEDLAKVMVQVKEDLNELNDFLDNDSIVFRNARWKVLFSDIFRHSFQKLQTQEMKKLVIYFLQKVSTGWQPKKKNAFSFCDESYQMMRKFKIKDLYVVVSVDIVLEESNYIQILKIWDILPLSGISTLVERLKPLFLHYTAEHKSRCQQRSLEGDFVVPMCWPFYSSRISSVEHELSSHYFDEKQPVESCKVNESMLLMKFYAFSSQVANHMLSGCDGKEASMPFELTDEEKKVIKLQRSSFVLGRSGTGKTTVIVSRLFRQQQLYHVASEGFHVIDKRKSSTILRQLFVTVNPRLCQTVKHQINRLNRFTCGEDTKETIETDIDAMEESSQFSDLPDSFHDLPSSSYPLVITYQKFLMMLDGSVGVSFFNKFDDVRAVSSKTSSSATIQTLIKTKEVTYGKFLSSYWSHFNQRITKYLDPSTVFMEIISYIKGGYQGTAPGGVLSKDDYVDFHCKQWYNLSKTEREDIYAIFKKYEKLKLIYDEFDLADLVIDLHIRLSRESCGCNIMDFVYVDEVQDLTMSQISLFKYISKNLTEGFVFAGDTAQAIAKGVSFRFQDIRALYHREFVTRSSESDSSITKKGIIDPLFYLSQNFRSHVGILQLANSVVKLLYKFFPSSLDKLGPETSLIHGSSPVLVETNDFISQFVDSESSEQCINSFGAEQAIIVRDEEVKNKILKHIRKKALILTVLECKGLEFQDVLFYNFFSTSSVKDSWRVLDGYLEDESMGDSAFKQSEVAWNEGKHKHMCAELKQLYVVITRTIQRLWIVEEEGFKNPIFNYWKRQHLVQVRTLDSEFAKAIQTQSSQDEWKSRGQKFFHQGNYNLAKICFEKSGHDFLAKWSEAAGLRNEANGSRSSTGDQTKLAAAARLYETIGKFRSAAECYVELLEYEKAGEIYLERFGESKREEAAECFFLAKLFERAAEIYSECKMLTKSISVCTEGNLFDVGWRYFLSWKAVKQSSCSSSYKIENFLQKGAQHYFNNQEKASMMKFVRAFSSQNSIRRFLRTRKLFDELLSLETESGNFLKAADVAAIMGDPVREAHLRTQGGQVKEACKLLLSHVLSKSLWYSEKNGWPLKIFEGKDSILMEAKDLTKHLTGPESEQFSDSVCLEADILSDEEIDISTMRQYLEHANNLYIVSGIIICARKIIDACLKQRNVIDDCLQHQKIINNSLPLPAYSPGTVTIVSDLIHYTRSWTMPWKYVLVHHLFHSWDNWFRRTGEVSDSLNHGLEPGNPCSDFCLSYFGLKMQKKGNETIYSLTYDNMELIMELNKEFSLRDDGSVRIPQFAQAAKNYWLREKISLGMKVVELLENLYSLVIQLKLSVSCQAMILVYLFNVTGFLLEVEGENDRYQVWYEQSLQKLFHVMFCLEWNNTLKKDVIFLKEKYVCGKIVRSLAESVTLSHPIPSMDEIGKVLTFWLSGILSHDIFDESASRIDEMTVGHESYFSSRKEPVLKLDWSKITGLGKDKSLVERLHGVMLHACYGDIETNNDYMSPTFFLYLMERLIILVSYPTGHFFSLRSSLLEWLSFERWDIMKLHNNHCRMELSFDAIIDHMVFGIQEILCNTKRTKKWVKHCKLTYLEHELFFSRLVLILCQICTTFGRHFHVLFDVLFVHEVRRLIPSYLFFNLGKISDQLTINENIKCISVGMESIENSLVEVNMNQEPQYIFVDSIIYLDFTILGDKKKILENLFRPRTRY